MALDADDPERRAALLEELAGVPDAGLRGIPDPDWQLGEYHLLAYLGAGDAERALAWFDDGLELALRTDDPEELAAQLLDLCDEALDRLDREPEDLHERADVFVRERWARRQRELEQREARDDHDLAEEDPADEDPGHQAGLPEPGGDITPRPLPEGVALQLVWIPPDVVDAYLAWCEREGHDPAARESRAQYAGVASQRRGSIAWPPGRNDPCWCRRGRKYKRCCGTVPRPQR